MHRLLPTFAILTAGCACEHGIGLSGDQDAADETSQSSWDPPIENLGEVGWRESTEPWCPEVTHRLAYSYDVWSHPGGVYVVAGEQNMDLDGRQYNQLFWNDGTGWSMAYEGEVEDLPGCTGGINSISGIPGGPVFAWNDELEPGSCSLLRIEGGVASPTEFSPTQVFVVGPTLAYACTDLGLLRYDGDSWARVAPLLDCPAEHSIRLWADETSLFAAGNTGLAYRLDETEWTAMDTGTFASLIAIWGFSDSDIWIGSSDGKLLRYDASTWREVDWPRPPEGGAVGSMWGKDGVLFMSTGRRLIRWDGSGFVVLLDTETDDGLEDVKIKAIWGNGSNEVFLAVVDEAHVREGCGDRYLLWWDGHEFHWF